MEQLAGLIASARTTSALPVEVHLTTDEADTASRIAECAAAGVRAIALQLDRHPLDEPLELTRRCGAEPVLAIDVTLPLDTSMEYFHLVDRIILTGLRPRSEESSRAAMAAISAVRMLVKARQLYSDTPGEPEIWLEAAPDDRYMSLAAGAGAAGFIVEFGSTYPRRYLR